MRRIAKAGAAAALAMLALGLAPAGASALFNQCPPVDQDTGCQFLITITDQGQSLQTDTTQTAYEGAEDALIGITNSSSKALNSIPLSASGLFSFDGDGLCNPGTTPVPTGTGQCQNPPAVAADTGAGGNPPCGPQSGVCSFPPPMNEPANYTEPGGFGVSGGGPSPPNGDSAKWSNGDIQNGYEGPTTYFTGVSTSTDSGVVVFSPPLPPGQSTYFALEEPPASGIVIGTATTVSTALSGAGQLGATIAVGSGTPVTDTATLGGTNAAGAGGRVAYAIYRDSACTQKVADAGVVNVANGVAGPSNAASSLPLGTYYWQASYTGDAQNAPANSTCGMEVLKVLQPTTTTTSQIGGGLSAVNLTVQAGTPVSDQARVAGPTAATATGTVNYVLYKDKACTVPVAPGSNGPVVKGLAVSSAPLAVPAGTYYWRATYSGDAVNGPSTSPCGSETLVVAVAKTLGLPLRKACFSKRIFVIHVRVPKNIKAVSANVLINGKATSRVRLGKTASIVNLRHLPKGTFHVAIVVTDATGATFEDTRTYHTCVKGRHRKRR